MHIIVHLLHASVHYAALNAPKCAFVCHKLQTRIRFNQGTAAGAAVLTDSAPCSLNQPYCGLKMT